jgi:membrane protein YqaA with SNARE-associated domain
MLKRVQSFVRMLQRYGYRWWYAPLVSLLAFADAFVVVIPTDGLLVSAVMLAPRRRWIYSCLIVTLGSAAGAWALAALLEVHGLPFLLELQPGLDHSPVWAWTNRLMDDWGGWALFLVSLSPIMQHPAVALAAIAGMPLTEVFMIVFLGRALKYGLLSWIASHTPKMLGRLWGMKEELEAVGVATDPAKR